MPDLCIVGSAVYDITARFIGEANTRDSNPSRVWYSCGGVGRNIAENAGRLGISTSLVTSLGRDEYGVRLAASVTDVGVDIGQAISTEASCSFISLLENTGELALAASNLEPLEAIPVSSFFERIDFINSHKLVLVDANLTELQLGAVAGNCTQRIMCETVSIAKAPRLLGILSRVDTLKTNARELGAIVGRKVGTRKEVETAARDVLNKGVKHIYTTFGGEGAHYAGIHGNVWIKGDNAGFVSIWVDALPADVMSVMGVGDAFAAGIAYSTLNGFEPKDTLRLATRMAYLTLYHPTAVRPDIYQVLD